MPLQFFNNIKWGFMCVPKNGKVRTAGKMINCIITPLSAGNASAVSCKYLPKFVAIEE